MKRSQSIDFEIKKRDRRSAVVVMTDGVDNALPGVFGEGSATTFEDLLKIVQRSDAIVLPIYLDTEKKEYKLNSLKDAYALARKDIAPGFRQELARILGNE